MLNKTALLNQSSGYRGELAQVAQQQADDRDSEIVTFIGRDSLGYGAAPVTVTVRPVGNERWMGPNPLAANVPIVFLRDPVTKRLYPRMYGPTSVELAEYERVESDNAPAVSRRSVAAALAAGGAMLGVGVIGVKPASAGIVKSMAEEVIGKAFGGFLSEVAAAAVLNPTIAPVYNATASDMQASGHRVKRVRGFRSAKQGGVITLDDAASCFAVASEVRGGCFVTVLPPECGAIATCLDEKFGLPALYTSRGRRFSRADALRYTGVVAAERRRGRCGLVSTFLTWGCAYVLEIEPLEPGFVRVEICNRETRERLQNKHLPTDASDPTKTADSGEWKIV